MHSGRSKTFGLVSAAIGFTLVVGLADPGWSQDFGIARCEDGIGRLDAINQNPTAAACLTNGLTYRTEVEASFLALFQLALGTVRNEAMAICQDQIERDLRELGCDPRTDVICRTNLLNQSRQRSAATLAQYEAYRARIASQSPNSTLRPVTNLSMQRAQLNSEQRTRAARGEAGGVFRTDNLCTPFIGKSPNEGPLAPVARLEDDSFQRARSVHNQLVADFEGSGYAPKEGRCSLGFPGMDLACLSLARRDRFYNGGAPPGGNPYYDRALIPSLLERVIQRRNFLQAFVLPTVAGAPVGVPRVYGNLAVDYPELFRVDLFQQEVACPVEQNLFGRTREECFGFTERIFGISFGRVNAGAASFQRVFAVGRPTAGTLPLCVDTGVVATAQGADPERCAVNARMEATRQCRAISGRDCVKVGMVSPGEQPGTCVVRAITDFPDCEMTPDP